MAPAPFDRVVVPLDGSPESGEAVPVALELARRWRVPLEFVHVAVPLPPSVNAPPLDTTLDRELANADVALLQASAGRVNEMPGMRAVPVLLRGEVVPTLVAHMEQSPRALVVMTTHGVGGLNRLWLGSVTDKLIRQIRQPVLVVPVAAPTQQTTAEEPMFRRILVPLDGSPLAHAALDVAAAFAFSHEIELHLVRVLEPLAMTEPFPDLGSMLELGRVAEAAAERQRTALDDLARVARSLGSASATVRVHAEIAARPATALLAYAREHAMNLIALATHGRGGIARVMLGSVTDKVLRGAVTPVVICRPATGDE